MLSPPGAVTQSCYGPSLPSSGGSREDAGTWLFSLAGLLCKKSRLETQWIPINHFMSTNNPSPLYTAHLSLHSNDSPCFASLLFPPFSLLLPPSVLVQEWALRTLIPLQESLPPHQMPLPRNTLTFLCHALFREILPPKIQIWCAVALPESKHLREHRRPCDFSFPYSLVCGSPNLGLVRYIGSASFKMEMARL